MIFAISSPGEIRALAVIDGTLMDLALERPGHPDHFGALFAATLIARVPSMAGAFLDIGGGLTGFLPDSEGAKGRSAGDRLPVRVTRAAQGGKGPRLSARVPDTALPAHPGLIAPGPGAIERLAQLHPSAPIVVDDLSLLAALPPALRARADRRPATPDGDILDRLAELEIPFAALPGGARAEITPTAALTAIDVDTQAATAHGTHEPTNRALIPALARELRLRNLSGGIVIDFAGLSPRGRARLGPALEQALATDPLAPKFLGFSALGLAEIVRARTVAPLHERLRGPVAALIAALRAAMRDPSARMLTAAPDVIAQADPATLADVARRRDALTLRADPAMPPGTWRLSAAPAIAAAAAGPQL